MTQTREEYVGHHWVVVLPRVNDDVLDLAFRQSGRDGGELHECGRAPTTLRTFMARPFRLSGDARTIYGV